MEAFRYMNGKLRCENADIGKAAAAVGTPFYIYSRRAFADNFRRLDKALAGSRHIICYACKANSNLSVFRLFARLGAGADIVSGGELYKALKAGVDPGKIVFAGVGKTEDEIRFALSSRILMFNVESVPELNLINDIAGKMRRKTAVAVRVNFGFDPHTHGYINTSRGSKFGIDMSMARGVFAYAKVLRNIDIAGLHSHIGSQITQTGPFVRNLRMALSLAESLKELGIHLRFINLGGGLGIAYREKESPVSVSSVGNIFRKLLKNSRRYTLILEPGRFLSANAGALVTKVLYAKESFGKKFVIVDAGMTDLIRPSLYGAYHRILPLTTVRSPLATVVSVVGPVCETGDFFALDRKMPVPGQGDLLAVMDAGAYGFEMSSNYNSRPRPAQVLVSGSRFSVIRKRETRADLVRGE